MTFWVKLFFLQKCLNLCVCFSIILVAEHSPVFFDWFALCFCEKGRQNIDACTMNVTKLNKSISAKKDTGECFSAKLKSACKNSGTFEGKKLTWKSHLHPSCTKPFNLAYLCLRCSSSSSLLIDSLASAATWTLVTSSVPSDFSLTNRYRRNIENCLET